MNGRGIAVVHIIWAVDDSWRTGDSWGTVRSSTWWLASTSSWVGGHVQVACCRTVGGGRGEQHLRGVKSRRSREEGERVDATRLMQASPVPPPPPRRSHLLRSHHATMCNSPRSSPSNLEACITGVTHAREPGSRHVYAISIWTTQHTMQSLLPAMQSLLPPSHVMTAAQWLTNTRATHQ